MWIIVLLIIISICELIFQGIAGIIVYCIISSRREEKNNVDHELDGIKWYSEDARANKISARIANSGKMILGADLDFVAAYDNLKTQEEKDEAMYFAKLSLDMDLPYCCIDEDEFYKLVGENTGYGFPVTGDPWGMRMHEYIPEKVDPMEHKCRYWKERFSEEVRNGNYKAILLAYEYNNYPELAEFCNIDIVKNAAKNGDAKAILALRKMCMLTVNTNNKVYQECYMPELFNYEATEALKELTDGCYFLSSRATRESFEAFKLLLRGAELANGYSTGCCQCWVAKAYDSTDERIIDGIEKNDTEAMMWYRKAAENKNYEAFCKVNGLEYRPFDYNSYISQK